MINTKESLYNRFYKLKEKYFLEHNDNQKFLESFDGFMEMVKKTVPDPYNQQFKITLKNHNRWWTDDNVYAKCTDELNKSPAPPSFAYLLKYEEIIDPPEVRILKHLKIYGNTIVTHKEYRKQKAFIENYLAENGIAKVEWKKVRRNLKLKNVSDTFYIIGIKK